jgi:hypothetical protein
MAFGQPVEVKYVFGVNEAQLQLIHAFLQGAVYSWIKNRGGDWFTAQGILGQPDFRKGTPLHVLFEKHTFLGKTSGAALRGAGIDLEWLLRSTLNRDPLPFELDGTQERVLYRWVSETGAHPSSRSPFEAGPGRQRATRLAAF